MKFISNDVTRQVGRTILVMKKNSPHLFFVGGLVGSVTSTYLACRATLKLEPVLDEIKHDLEQVKTKTTLSDTDQKEHVRELTYVYGKSAQKLIRLYGPAALVGFASVGSLTGSHVQMTRRNSALTATAAAISKAYDDYRDRVRERIGEEEELALHRGIVNQEVTIDGKKQTVPTISPDVISGYARLFDEASPNWKKDPGHNQFFVKSQEIYANHLLQSRGHVFLNEVYDQLGLERSPAGAICGWVLNGETSDNHISFGLEEVHAEPFLEGSERSVLLDFNVDGIVYDKI